MQIIQMLINYNVKFCFHLYEQSRHYQCVIRFFTSSILLPTGKSPGKIMVVRSVIFSSSKKNSSMLSIKDRVLGLVFYNIPCGRSSYCHFDSVDLKHFDTNRYGLTCQKIVLIQRNNSPGFIPMTFSFDPASCGL
jgi:hypothetical protein